MGAQPRATQQQAAHPDETVGPLERGFAVLRALAAAPGGRLRPSELTKSTGLARSTVDRLAATLAELGYLRAEGDGRDLVLAPAAARPGNAYLRACGFPRLLGPLAEELSARLDESVSLAVPDRESVRFIVQIKRRRAFSVTFRVGDALPAERCAPGAVFARGWGEEEFAAWHARLEQDPDYAGFPALPTHRPETESVASFRRRIAAAAKSGYAEDDQLIEKGLIALAVPVFDEAGDAVCALSVVSHTSRQTVASLREATLPMLLAAAEAMSDRLASSTALEPAHSGRDPIPDSAMDAAELAEDPTAAAKGQYGPDYLQSLARGISVLSGLGEGGPRGLTLSEAAAATGLARATARRSLLTSAHQGYVETDGARFRILPRVLELGYARLGRLSHRGGGAAAPGADRANGARIRVDGGARRRGRALRGARGGGPDHERGHHDRHSLPRLRDVDGPDAAGRSPALRAKEVPGAGADQATDAAHRDRRARAAPHHRRRRGRRIRAGGSGA
jgi:IclR family pca regulon transcriptional regulator